MSELTPYKTLEERINEILAEQFEIVMNAVNKYMSGEKNIHVEVSKSKKAIQALIAREVRLARIDEYRRHLPHRKISKGVWAVTVHDIEERIAELEKESPNE